MVIVYKKKKKTPSGKELFVTCVLFWNEFIILDCCLSVSAFYKCACIAFDYMACAWCILIDLFTFILYRDENKVVKIQKKGKRSIYLSIV